MSAARLMDKHEYQFFIEGEKELESYNKYSEKLVSEEDLKKVVKIVLKMATGNGLVAVLYGNDVGHAKSEKRSIAGIGRRPENRLPHAL